MAKESVGGTWTALSLRGTCNYDPARYLFGIFLEIGCRMVFLSFHEDDCFGYDRENHVAVLMDLPIFFDAESKLSLKEILFSADVPNDLMFEVEEIFYDKNKCVDGVLHSFDRIDIECKLDRKGIDSKHYRKKRAHRKTKD